MHISGPQKHNHDFFNRRQELNSKLQSRRFSTVVPKYIQWMMCVGGLENAQYTSPNTFPWDEVRKQYSSILQCVYTLISQQ